MDRNYPARTGESDVMRHSPRHRWLYFPQMRPRQALPLRTADAVDDGRAGLMCHCVFEDPDSPPGAPARERIEVRMMGFFCAASWQMPLADAWLSRSGVAPFYPSLSSLKTGFERPAALGLPRDHAQGLQAHAGLFWLGFSST